MKQAVSGMLIGLSCLVLAAAANAQDETEKDYFSQPGLDVLIFSNWYDGLFADAKISGVEIIHHGQRTVTNGDVRLSPTPGQWEPIGSFTTRRSDVENGVIEADLRYGDYDFDYTVRVERTDDDFVISIELPNALPDALIGKAGFNLEFIPSVYGGKGLLADSQPGILPVYPSSDMSLRAQGPRPDGAAAEPLPIATGTSLVLAPGDDNHRISIRSTLGQLALYDGRNQAQNGWFVVRGLLPANTTGRVLEWHLKAATTPDWRRAPVISYNQLGYRPDQNKVAIVELDARGSGLAEMQLLRIGEDGTAETVMSGPPELWGQYLRYDYARFDFSQISQPGLYMLDYAGQRSASFRIAENVYDTAWHPTLDVFFPVQMDHMFVNEAYRVWHGKPHMDDALQAPVDHEHHDLYRQGATTDTAFGSLQHIPGLNVGGWFDAGDFDIRTQSQYDTIRSMVMVWDAFGLQRDQTRVDWDRQRADIHVPDGSPDLLQQIAHGTLQLLAQFDAVGFAIHGIVEPDLDQYTHLGDAVTKTDNLIYSADLGPDDVNEGKSGRLDDRWAFTSRSSALQYGSAAGLASAARALRGYDDTLAEKALNQAKTTFADEESRAPDLFRHGNTTGGPLALERFRAAGELLLTTGDPYYVAVVEDAWGEVAPYFGAVVPLAVSIRPLMPDAYEARLRTRIDTYLAARAEARSDNPFGVQITRGGWAGSNRVVANAVADYVLHMAYPDLVSKDRVFDGFDFILGRHPGHNLSLVSGVGAQSKLVAYGNNRADFSYIAGGVVPGILIIKPDFPENHEDWPFFWGENEYVIPVAARYIFLANAVARLDREGS